jgi:ComEC/Rec2-related protein
MQINLEKFQSGEQFNLVLFSLFWMFVGILFASKGVSGDVFNHIGALKVLGIFFTVCLFGVSVVIARWSILMIGVSVLFGFGLWKIEERGFAKNTVTGYHTNVLVGGYVSNIVYKNDKTQLYLTNVSTDMDEYPHLSKIAVVADADELDKVSLGDKISFHGRIFKLPKLVFPTAYPYPQKLKFTGIEGMGKIDESLSVEVKSAEFHPFDMARKYIRKRFYETMSTDNANVALAFLIGDNMRIKQDVRDAIRDSGLSHVLAISGFHLAVIAGFVIFCIHAILRRSVWMCLNVDIKKASYTVAIIVSFVYLLLADSPLPAVRSFIMLFLVLFAIITNRIPTQFRTLIFAGIFILISAPYEIYFASFQLSFVAILSLGLSYALLERLKIRFKWLNNKFYYYTLGIFITSLYAGLITEPFILHHFGNFSTVSVLSNMLCIPLTSFFIMPVGFLSLLFLPVPFVSWALLKLTEYGIVVFVKIAEISSEHFPSLALKNLSSEILFIYLLGLICLVFFSSRLLKNCGIGMICFAFVMYFAIPAPSFFANHRFAVFRHNGKYYAPKPISDEFVEKIWLQELGQREFYPYTCTDFCEITDENTGKSIGVITGKHYTPTPDQCADYEQVINLGNTKKLPCPNYHNIHDLYTSDFIL